MNINRTKSYVVVATTLLLGTIASEAGFAKSVYSRMHLHGHVSRVVAQADVLMRISKYSEAEQLFHEALNKDKNDLSARAGLGMALAKNFKLDRADEEFDKVLKVDPENPTALCGKAVATINRLQSSSMTWSKNKAGLLKDAESDCNRALQYDPKSPEANYTLGVVLKEQGQFDRAEVAFNKAIELDKNYSDAYAGVGMVRLQNSDMVGALTNFKQAIAMNTANSTAHYGLGKALLQQGQLDEAIKELNTALYQYRNSAPVHFELGRAYEQQGNTVGAIREYQESIRIKPELAAPYVHIADIRENRGDIEHAVAELRAGLELIPNNPELLLRVANNNLRLEKVDDAIKDYEKVLNAAPRSTVAADGLTRAFYLKAQKESTGAFFASNDYQNAEQSIDRAVSMNPNNLELRLAQAKLYALAGKQVELSTIGQPRNDGERIAYAEALLAQNKFKESSEQMSYLIGQTNTAKPLFALADLSLIIKDLDSANAAYKKASSLPDGAERAKWGLDQVAKARDLARQDMTMAEDLARRKQLASAVDKYHSSIFANPRSAEAREGLATALEKLYPNDPKEMREATTQLKAFLALTPALPAKEQEKVEKHIAKLETHASKMERQIATVPHRTSAFSRFGIHR